MRYYVEINGESSLNIQGLMIQSLPSISKPLMRSKQETIDGRDGDIVTKLGYSAYDKTLKIGLWGNYDINEVIAFFNQEGTITFSNEPDKYYRFTILNREDYVSQLDKFRTCTIALHCQPYKYKLNEEAEELENEYVEQEGTSLTFTNTLVAPMNIDLKGNTLQNGTPTPSSPIPVNNVSGDNDIVVIGKNLLKNEATTDTKNGITFTINNDKSITISGTASAQTSFKFTPTQNETLFLKAGNYTLSTDYLLPNGVSLQLWYSTATILKQITEGYKEGTFNVANDTNYTNFRGQIVIENGKSFTTPITIYPMLRNSLSSETYEAYNGTTYNIDLPVENKYSNNNATFNDSYTTHTLDSTNKITITSTYSWANCEVIIPNLKPSTTYAISTKVSNTNQYNCGIWVASGGDYDVSTEKSFVSKRTFATDSSGNLSFRLYANFTSDTSKTGSVVFDEIQVQEGTSYNSYTPYGTTPIELNKIGTYQDYFYKDSGKWYLHKEIGKKTLDSTSEWNRHSSGCFYDRTNEYNGILPPNNTTLPLIYCNYFPANTYQNTFQQGQLGFAIAGDGTANPRIAYPSITTVNDFKTFISNNNIFYYYVLATPTNTEITYTPLIEQLESIKNAMSKEGTTNVNQVNNDAPFILDASVLSGTDSITLTNEGNTTSKPTLTITGSGVVGVYLENIQMFNISLGTNETIIIDTENMEAYYGSQLKNRQVTGDYSNFALQSGTNNLKFTGVVTNVEITNYNRWI